jgi:hypothetical protein
MKKSNVLAALLMGVVAISSCKKNGGDDPIVVETVDSTSLANPFFDKVSYKGAFGTTDWTAGWANFNPKTTVYPATNATLSGSITTNTTLDASKVYLLSGFVYVESGVTLTIPAGTIIRGDKVSKATLVVTKGAKLIAEGTAAKPIIFTSNVEAGRAPGDWGGIVILGKAIHNLGGGVIEGGFTEPKGLHGGAIPMDNSGILKYVRIEFPGIAFTNGNEINGLTFGSVGSGTTVDYVQVAYSGDDSFEFFGGSVNAKHLISTANVDDAFDFDNGYVGKLQFCVAQRDPSLADAAGQSNGIEADNSEKDFSIGPRTRPVISNMTIIGPGNVSVDAKHEYSNLWRRGAKMILANSVFIGGRYGIDIRDKETSDALVDGSSVIKNNIWQSYTADRDVVAGGTNANTAYTAAVAKTYLSGKGNTILTETDAAALLATPFSLTAPSFVLKANSAASAGASFE